MLRSAIAAFVVGGIVITIVAFVVVLLLVKVMWAWTVPELFPGAVTQGLVVGSISWLAAVKIAIFVAILSVFARSSSAKHRRG